MTLAEWCDAEGHPYALIVMGPRRPRRGRVREGRECMCGQRADAGVSDVGLRTFPRRAITASGEDRT